MVIVFKVLQRYGLFAIPPNFLKPFFQGQPIVLLHNIIFCPAFVLYNIKIALTSTWNEHSNGNWKLKVGKYQLSIVNYQLKNCQGVRGSPCAPWQRFIFNSIL